MATIKLTLAELEPRLNRLMSSIRDPHAVLDDIGFQMVQTTIRRFTEQKAPDSTPWKPLSKITIGARVGRGGGAKILLDTGLLRSSISSEVVGDTLHVGTPEKYAGIHQVGGEIKPKSAKFLAIPARAEARLQRPRSVPGLFVKRRGDRLYLVGKTQKGALRIWYILKKSVKIPARPFIGFTDEDFEYTVKIIFDHIEKNA